VEPSLALNPDRVQELMDQREMSRRELCDESGISESYLSRIFNRRIRATNPEMIERFAEALGVEPGELTSRPETPPVRVAAPPHLWSAPFLNRAERNGNGPPPFEVLEGDQGFTGGDALAALRRGASDLALAFETPLDMTDDSDVAVLGSICAGSDYVRLLVRRGSPLLEDLRRFDSDGVLGPRGDRSPAGDDRDDPCEPTAVVHGETIAVEYLRHLEETMPSLDRVRLVTPDAGRPWLGGDGRPVHLILIWEPMASAIVAASAGEMVDVFDALEDRLPLSWLPRPAEYQLLVSQTRRVGEVRLRQVVRDLQAAVLEMNHYIGKSRLVLQSQPVIDRLIQTLPYALDDAARAQVRQLLARRLGQVRFRLRLWPEMVTGGFL